MNQFTVSVSDNVRTVAPEVAVTVSVDVPVGVLTFGGVLRFSLVPVAAMLHPMHAVSSTTASPRLGRSRPPLSWLSPSRLDSATNIIGIHSRGRRLK
jgi:hypothetical protein